MCEIAQKKCSFFFKCLFWIFIFEPTKTKNNTVVATGREGVDNWIAMLESLIESTETENKDENNNDENIKNKNENKITMKEKETRLELLQWVRKLQTELSNLEKSLARQSRRRKVHIKKIQEEIQAEMRRKPASYIDEKGLKKSTRNKGKKVNYKEMEISEENEEEAGEEGEEEEEEESSEEASGDEEEEEEETETKLNARGRPMRRAAAKRISYKE